jgi:carbonic anhydrase
MGAHVGVLEFSRRWLLGAGVTALAVGPHGVTNALAREQTGGITPTTPDEAVAELASGNARFVKGELLQPRRELDRVRQMAEKQQPYAAVLGCADSRVPIEIVFDEGFGDVFVVRVAGNLATPVEIASLEYGVAVLGVKVVMVLGHDGCGAVKAALDGKAVPGQISTLYQYIVPGIDRAKHDLAAAVRANVQFQARTLRQSSPVLSAAVSAGSLKIVGGVFELMSGRVVPVEV